MANLHSFSRRGLLLGGGVAIRNKTWQTCTVSVAVDCCSEAVSL